MLTENQQTQASMPSKSPRRLFPRPALRPIWVALLLLVLLCLIIAPTTLSIVSLRSMLPFASFLAIAAVGQALVIGQGGFDFSVAGIITMSAVLVTHTSGSENAGLPAGMLIALAAALTAGFVNGVVVTRLNITPLVATLATNAILIGVVLNVSDSVPVPAPKALSDFTLSSTLAVPNTVWIAIVFVALFSVVVRKTVPGRRMVLTGTNPRAARVVGVRVNAYIIGTYVVAGFCYWAAGLCLAGYVGNPGRNTGDPYIMLTITAVVLGGAALSGGRVSLLRTAVASVFLIQTNQLIISLGASTGVQYLVQAAVVAFAVLAGARGLHLPRSLARTRNAPTTSRTALP